MYACMVMYVCMLHEVVSTKEQNMATGADAQGRVSECVMDFVMYLCICVCSCIYMLGDRLSYCCQS